MQVMADATVVAQPVAAIVVSENTATLTIAV